MSRDIRQLKVTRSAQLRNVRSRNQNRSSHTHSRHFWWEAVGLEVCQRNRCTLGDSQRVILPGLETFVLGSWRGSFLKLGRLVAK